MSREEKIAVLASVSFNTELVKRQLNNYKLSHGYQAIHFLHLAKDGDINEDELTVDGIDICAASSEYSTSNLCNFGGQIANSKRLFSKADNLSIDYVYIHTDADLIVQGDLARYIRLKECAYLKQKPAEQWPHYRKMMDDPCFKAMRKHLNIADSEIVMGRQEGAFFPVELWQEMVDQFEKFYPLNFFSQKKLLWPIEEGIVPTIAKWLISNNYTCYDTTTKNIVVTKPLKPSPDKRNPRDVPENCVNIDDINAQLLKQGKESCIAMKWFARELNDTAANYANKLLLKSSHSN